MKQRGISLAPERSSRIRIPRPTGRSIKRLLLAALVAWPFVAFVAARALVVNAELPRADAIVVLSGASSYVERARHAARLFHEGRAPRVILTNDDLRGGWSSEQQRNPYFHERAREELVRAGVPAERIEVLPQVVASTYEEAVQVRLLIGMRGLHSIIIVTSPYHTRRAGWVFRRVLAESGVAIGLLSPPAGQQQSPTPATWWLRPSGWKLVALEYPKLVFYRLRYG